MLPLPAAASITTTVRSSGYASSPSTGLLQFPVLWAEAVCSSHVVECYGREIHCFGFVTYLVYGSQTILLAVKPYFQFRISREDFGAVLRDPELYPSSY